MYMKYIKCSVCVYIREQRREDEAELSWSELPVLFCDLLGLTWGGTVIDQVLFCGQQGRLSQSSAGCANVRTRV